MERSPDFGSSVSTDTSDNMKAEQECTNPSWLFMNYSVSNATPKAARLFSFARVQFRDVDDGHYFHSCCLFGCKILRGCIYFFNGRSKCSNTKCNSTAVYKYSLKH